MFYVILNQFYECQSKLQNKNPCYLLVNVQEIRIQPYFCVKQGEYFFHFFWDTLYIKFKNFVFTVF